MQGRRSMWPERARDFGEVVVRPRRVELMMPDLDQGILGFGQDRGQSNGLWAVRLRQARSYLDETRPGGSRRLRCMKRSRRGFAVLGNESAVPHQ